MDQNSFDNSTSTSGYGEGRRGSSLFDPPASDGDGPYGRPSYLNKSGDLLVEFPSRDEDYDEMSEQQPDDYSMRSTNSAQRGKKRNSGGRLSESARMEELANAQLLPGSQNYRPLVGGFAAAAYEAAKEHHYTKARSSRQTKSMQKQRPLPPSI